MSAGSDARTPTRCHLPNERTLGGRGQVLPPEDDPSGCSPFHLGGPRPDEQSGSRPKPLGPWAVSRRGDGWWERVSPAVMQEPEGAEGAEAAHGSTFSLSSPPRAIRVNRRAIRNVHGCLFGLLVPVIFSHSQNVSKVFRMGTIMSSMVDEIGIKLGHFLFYINIFQLRLYFLSGFTIFRSLRDGAGSH